MARILIVDDEISLCRFMGEQLAELGHEADYLDDPQRFFEQLEQGSYDVILLDIQMPKIDGIQLLKTIRSQPDLDDLPVIILTADTNEQTLEICFQSGASDYMTKPVHELVLNARVEAVLAERQRKTSLRRKIEDRDRRLEHLQAELGHFGQRYEQWQQLPESIRQAMEEVLLKFSADTSQLNEDLQATLLRITTRYGELLSKFVHRAQPQSETDRPRLIEEIALLKQLPLFNGLSHFDLENLVERMEEIRVKPNTDLLSQNQPTQAVYFVSEGQVEILVNGELVAHRGRGDAFGEMSCLKGEPDAAATVRTLTECRVLKIRREDFMEIVDRLPQLWRHVFRDVGRRFNELTHRLSELFQHSPQGLVKVDAEGRMTTEFSNRCAEYLGTRQLQGKSLNSILFAGQPTVQTGWQEVYPLLFAETMMDFSSIAGLLPTATEFDHPDGRKRIFKLWYFPCRDDKNRLTAVDVGIEDITAERLLEKERKLLQTERQILTKIYDDPDAYLNLLQLAEETLEMMTRLIKTLEAGEIGVDQSELKRRLHTLKGISALFSFEALREISHRLESRLGALEDTTLDTALTRLKTESVTLQEATGYARSFIEQMADNVRQRLTGVVLSREVFAALKEAVTAGNLTNAARLLSQAELIPITQLVHHWPEEIRRLGDRLGKQIDLKVIGDRFTISKERFQQLEPALVHILRNAVDHGLETPQERQVNGKSPRGCITFEAHYDSADIVLVIEDDGRGLDSERILKKAAASQTIAPSLIERFVRQQRIWELLFLPDFSTAEQVTDLSGRGVGLDAVKAVIERLRGSIDVVSQPSAGTRFVLRFPASAPDD
jgi:DNA-binding response OmpR family regulator/CRP-like cAMP-binding protein/signal transduction histidine kinase